MTPSVIVVGGGIVGAATAWRLATEGESVLLLEAGRFGRESTGKSAAIVRCHYSNPEVVRMAVYSREMFRQLPLHLECDPVYTRAGWLFLVDAADAPLAVQNVEMQELEGLESVDVESLEDYLPGIDPAGIAYAVHEPDSGFADPVAATEAYISAMRRAGGEAREGAVVESIEVEHGKVRGVRVAGELVPCETVVLAAGPWSLGLGRTAGIELPLEIVREQDVIFATAPQETVPCCVSSQVDRIYMRPAPECGEGHLLIGRGFPKDYENADPDGYETEVDDSFEADVRERLTRRLPHLAGVRRAGGRVGLYDVTPDWHPLLGDSGEVESLVLATGGSGHCFKLGPAIGDLVAASILGGKVGYAEIVSFSPARFEEGREFRSTFGGNRA
ncbi:MAG TPA: FAD-binding oxidoreductase [Gaiellaceae bacterium]|nr:FAD-binding oxidoreductase [Gaiellaceae bacterium]